MSSNSDFRPGIFGKFITDTDRGQALDAWLDDTAEEELLAEDTTCSNHSELDSESGSELDRELHEESLQPVREELLVQSNNKIGLGHSKIHFGHIIREDPTDVTQLDPSDRQIYLSDPENHLSTWDSGRDNRFYDGEVDEFTKSQEATKWVDNIIGGIQAPLGYNRFLRTLIQAEEWDPAGCDRFLGTLIQAEAWDPAGCSAGSLESEPYFGPDEEIPFFEDMVDTFANVFGGVTYGKMFILLNYVRRDPQGVLFWSWKIIYLGFVDAGGWSVAAKMMLTLYQPGAFIAFFYRAFPNLEGAFAEYLRWLGLDED